MMDYEPTGAPSAVCAPGEFIVAATHLDHGHVYSQCEGLEQAGALVKWVHDPDPVRAEQFRAKFPSARIARCLEEVLDDRDVQLVAAAAVPSERGPLGCCVLRAGKHYFTDKAPFTTLEQLAEARCAVAESGRKYAVYYGERLHSECSVHAGRLVKGGAIGRVIQTLGTGPHRLNAASRPAWFFDRGKNGGIICDLGSHQVEQFLFFTDARATAVKSASARNFAHPQYRGFQDFGECLLEADNGASGYFRVDWLTPDGLSTWGDVRLFILGTEGSIELRKNVDIAAGRGPDHLYIVDGQGEHHVSCAGKVGFPFFGELILDCLNGTEKSMTQEHAFAAAELSLSAQAIADGSGPP
jgi:predicted dehydrogenase